MLSVTLSVIVHLLHDSALAPLFKVVSCGQTNEASARSKDCVVYSEAEQEVLTHAISCPLADALWPNRPST